MSLRNVEIQVFKLDDENFEPLGVVNKFTSLIWPDKFNGYATFELNAPINEENKNLLKKRNVIWCGGENAAKIEIITVEVNEEGEKTFKVKGRTLEQILTTRIIWDTYNCSNKFSSTAMYEIVKSNCVSPSYSERKIPFLECAEDNQVGKKISFQRTGGEVYDSIETIAKDSDLGFDILFKPREKKLVFKVSEGIDRTIYPQEGSPSSLVVFSTELEDILSSSYYTNDQDEKTLAYVAGEGEGSNRVHVISGNNASKGFDRKETYIDARDVTSQVIGEGGGTTQLTEHEYRELLNDRGVEKLSEAESVETFEAKMRNTGQYIYGVDYSKGDKVIVEDAELGIQVSAIVTEAIEYFNDKHELEIVFGYSYPTLIQRIKRKL